MLIEVIRRKPLRKLSKHDFERILNIVIDHVEKYGLPHTPEEINFCVLENLKDEFIENDIQEEQGLKGDILRMMLGLVTSQIEYSVITGRQGDAFVHRDDILYQSRAFKRFLSRKITNTSTKQEVELFLRYKILHDFIYNKHWSTKKDYAKFITLVFYLHHYTNDYSVAIMHLDVINRLSGNYCERKGWTLVHAYEVVMKKWNPNFHKKNKTIEQTTEEAILRIEKEESEKKPHGNLGKKFKQRENVLRNEKVIQTFYMFCTICLKEERDVITPKCYIEETFDQFMRTFHLKIPRKTGVIKSGEQRKLSEYINSIYSLETVRKNFNKKQEYCFKGITFTYDYVRLEKMTEDEVEEILQDFLEQEKVENELRRYQCDNNDCRNIYIDDERKNNVTGNVLRISCSDVELETINIKETVSRSTNCDEGDISRNRCEIINEHDGDSNREENNGRGSENDNVSAIYRERDKKNEIPTLSSTKEKNRLFIATSQSIESICFNPFRIFNYYTRNIYEIHKTNREFSEERARIIQRIVETLRYTLKQQFTIKEVCDIITIEKQKGFPRMLELFSLNSTENISLPLFDTPQSEHNACANVQEQQKTEEILTFFFAMYILSFLCYNKNIIKCEENMENPIEKYKKIDEQGKEYWSSSTLKKLCNLSGEVYSNALKKTIRFINSFGYLPKEQIVPIRGEDGKIKEYRFTRRALYLFVMGLDFDGAHAIGNFIATTQLYLMSVAYELNKSDAAEVTNKTLYEKEKDEFSIEVWINEYKEERLILKTWPEQRWKQFETLLFGLTRKLGSKEEAIKYATVLDKHSGEKYKDDAVKVAESMLVRFKFVANDPSYNRERTIEQKKASLERKQKFEKRQMQQQKESTRPSSSNRPSQQRGPIANQRRPMNNIQRQNYPSSSSYKADTRPPQQRGHIDNQKRTGT